ncbi:MAG: hypothetical protein WC413_03615 [Candidatus Nanoarchaeia archaeon]
MTIKSWQALNEKQTYSMLKFMGYEKEIPELRKDEIYSKVRPENYGSGITSKVFRVTKIEGSYGFELLPDKFMLVLEVFMKKEMFILDEKGKEVKDSNGWLANFFTMIDDHTDTKLFKREFKF